MAEDSVREQVIEYIVGQLEELEDLRSITRKKPEHADLGTIASTQLPAAAVIAGYPVPVKHQVGRAPGADDVFLSELAIDVWVYDHVEDADADTKLSSLADDVWAKLWENQTRGDLVHSSTCAFQPLPIYQAPFVGFILTVSVTYKHTTGGI